MATLVTKTILPPDTYVSPDKKFSATVERAKHWQAQHKKAEASGLVIPMHWNHSKKKEEMLPLTNEQFNEKAQHTVGRLADVTLVNGGAGGIELKMEVTDPVAAGRVERNEVFVSPVIWEEPFTDGRGTTLQDFFGCIDLVNYPVDQNQQPFKKVAAGLIPCAIRLGLEPGYYRLAQDGPPDDDADENKVDPAPKTNDNPDVFAGEKSDREKQIESILSYLPQLTPPIVLPSDTTEDNIWDRLQTGLMTAVEASRKQETTEDDTVDDKKTAKEEVPSPGLMTMSLAQSAEGQYVLRQHRANITKDLEQAVSEGRMTPAKKAELLPLVGAVRLSLDPNTKEPIPSDVERWIEFSRTVPKGTFFSTEAKTRMSTIVDPPADMADPKPMTPEEAEAKARQMHGGKKVAAAT